MVISSVYKLKVRTRNSFPRKHLAETTLSRVHISLERAFAKYGIPWTCTSPKLHLPESSFGRNYTCQKLRFPEIAFPRKLIFQNLHWAEITFPRKLIFLNLHLAEITFLRKLIFQNLHLAEISLLIEFTLRKIYRLNYYQKLLVSNAKTIGGAK